MLDLKPGHIMVWCMICRDDSGRAEEECVGEGVRSGKSEKVRMLQGRWYPDPGVSSAGGEKRRLGAVFRRQPWQDVPKDCRWGRTGRERSRVPPRAVACATGGV